jgi:porin
MIALGGWRQTGKVQTPDGTYDNGAGGLYLFGSQRLWARRPGQDNSGVSGFYQFGINNSNTMMVRQYVGGGLTGFGLTPGRPLDTMGAGLALSFLNRDPNGGQFFFPSVRGPSTRLRASELMLSTYYQMHLWSSTYFQPTFTYIPNPGQRPDIPSAVALTLRLILLF